MTSSLRVLFLSVFVSLALAHTQESFKQIRIFVPDKATLDIVWSTGIDFEGSSGKIGGWMEFVASDHELQQLVDKGIPYETLIDDLANFYERRLTPGPVNALGFGYGSMGGFYTFAEVIQQLDSMRLLYPNLITAMDSIGRSTDNRAIWLVKISDNPTLQEPSEPEVLYTALHHAREPQGMMTILYYMWWLLENYGTNQEATYLVNNRQMYFIPVVNPDGYVHNQNTNPNGGGMWRKNRRNNGDGSYGVDPNRNYGPYYMWNAPNGGSSTTPSSETYRGPSEFSEPENQAINNFMRSHNIKTAFNYHTYGNYLIYPFGYLSRENGDSLIYRDWTYDMTFANHYTNGTDQQTVSYSTRGNSDDYMFGDTTKPITYTMTPEVGTSGFWPPTNQIFPLAIENLPQNKLLAYFAGHYTTLRQHEIQDAGDGFIDRGESFALVTTWKNRGLNTAADLNVTISSSTPYVVFPSRSTQVTIPAQYEQLISFSGFVHPQAVVGLPFEVFFTCTDADGFLKRDTVKLYLGTPTVVFADSATNGTGNWNTGTGWGTTANAHTPPSAFTDSPTGNYANNANNSLTLNNQLSLNGYDAAELRYWTKWAVEPSWDFATVEISTNNGSTWTTLRSSLSHSGSGRNSQTQPLSTWGYESYTPGLTWVEQKVDLSSYVNRQIRLRFRLRADGGDNRDGFYVDDIRVYGYSLNFDSALVVLPTQFTFNGATGQVFSDSLKIINFTENTLQITIAETSGTSRAVEGRNSVATNSRLAWERLASAFRRANITQESFRQQFNLLSKNSDPSDPQAFSTIITDERNEFGFGAVDVYRLQHQFEFRPFPVAGNYHDFRIVFAPMADTNVAGFISIDTDQNFGTGTFPTPFGIGPTSRDVGSEFEIFFDASGILIDSLIGIGRIPAGVLLRSTLDSLTVVGSPFLLDVRVDSVLTVTTNGLGLGIRDEWLADPDRNMNVALVASRVTGNPVPDLAPLTAHGVVGNESGVSWLTEDTTGFTLASGDSMTVGITAVAAKPAGNFSATLRVVPNTGMPVNIPVNLTVNNTSPPHIVISTTSFTDTVMVGDSLTSVFTIENTGRSMLTYGILDTAGIPWVSIVPPFGVLDSGQTVLSTITLRAIGLAAESTYTARVFVISNDPGANAIPLDITMAVAPPTAVRDERSAPTEYALFQNYPNPFNPETKIVFDIPSRQFVSLKIYNLLGQWVAMLLNEELPPGRYSIRFDTNRFHLASGVYLYRMTAGSYSITKKMLLMK